MAQNPCGDILQIWEWGEVKRSPAWEVIRVGVFKNEQLLCVAQILRRRLFKFFSLLYCPRGPVIDWDQENSLEVLPALAGFVKEKIAKPSDLFLRIEPALENDKVQSSNFKSSSKFKFQNSEFVSYFKSIQPKHTSIVDLSRGEDEIIASFEKDTRNSVHRAQREGVVVKKTDSFDDWQKFYDLYKQTSQRGLFTPRPWSQFEKIRRAMLAAGQAQLYLASFGNQILAGSLILKIGAKAYYLWGASSRDYPKKFAPYLLQWEIIRDLKESGTMVYDLWGVAPTDNPKHSWSGHTLFKKGFKGRIIDYIGCFDLPLSPIYPIFRAADYLRQKIEKPDLIA